ncbi:MAG: hypothetical protein ACLPKB_29340 [Xanthobacteraceae bacterium]
MSDEHKVSSDASEAADQGGRVVLLRPRKGSRGSTARRLSAIDPQNDPAWLREQRPDDEPHPDQAGGLEPGDGKEDDAADNRFRMLSNIIGVALIAILIGTGVWLAHAIADMRKMQDCVLSGRRNCAPIELPASSR